ncbi:histone-lysine N-trimethyltransferase SMYD5 [Topomyia yanbarensis]|uniref:histone-lysine N-trimethyltransferase SMYD5 n=1 Tax=Topomyia yanbarensis TaxID=2498891 RepID=UPI00273C938F|nr:histone-lysine N-trimethyltransferase SMYD5 [Topomyia yanbarensis]
MSMVKVQDTGFKGRGLFAVVPIKAGTVLFEESPLVSCQFSWNSSYGYLACEYCLRPLETAESNVRRLTNDYTINLPYPECCTVQEQLSSHTKCTDCMEMYCGAECLQNALQLYHRVLCLGANRSDTNHPINALVEFWKNIHFPPETSSIMLVIKIIAMFKQHENTSKLRTQFEDFVSQTVNQDLMIFHKMLGENFSQQIEQLYDLICNAFDPSSDKRLHWLSLSGFRSLLALIGTNGQGIGTSSFADWVRNVTDIEMNEMQREALDVTIDNLYNKLDDVVGSFLNNEGSALYARQSKVNHSCAPNTECRFPHSNNVLALTTIRDIDAGQEICISYLDECALERSRHSRQKMLSENYLFQCKCEKCESQVADPDETSEEEGSSEEEQQMDDDSD